MPETPITLREHRIKHLTLAAPVMASQLGQISVGVADTIMVGQLGTTDLAAVGLCVSLQSLFLLFGIGMSYGITPLVASADGENAPGKAWFTLRHGLLVCIGTGLLLAAGGFGLVPFMPHMDQPQDVVVLAQPYYQVLAVSWIPMMVFQAYRQFTEGLSFTRQAMNIALAGNLLNIGLNYVLIFGKLGMPEYGIMGAGYATLISRVFMAIAMAAYAHTHKRFAPHRGSEGSKGWSREGFRSMLKIGLPAGIQYTFEVSAF
ncbi:MAG TPA: MATE family efflux transporter, partial [Cytophagales bacterium]|nr:MATE family efflux transporter [Cytophagales bacterium]